MVKRYVKARSFRRAVAALAVVSLTVPPPLLWAAPADTMRAVGLEESPQTKQAFLEAIGYQPPSSAAAGAEEQGGARPAETVTGHPTVPVLSHGRGFLAQATQLMRVEEVTPAWGDTYVLEAGGRAHEIFLTFLRDELRALPFHNEVGETILMRSDAQDVVGRFVNYLTAKIEQVKREKQWDSGDLGTLNDIFAPGAGYEVFKNEIYRQHNIEGIGYSLDLRSPFPKIILNRYHVSWQRHDPVMETGKLILELSSGLLTIELGKEWPANVHYDAGAEEVTAEEVRQWANVLSDRLAEPLATIAQQLETLDHVDAQSDGVRPAMQTIAKARDVVGGVVNQFRNDPAVPWALRTTVGHEINNSASGFGWADLYGEHSTRDHANDLQAMLKALDRINAVLQELRSFPEGVGPVTDVAGPQLTLAASATHPPTEKEMRVVLARWAKRAEEAPQDAQPLLVVSASLLDEEHPLVEMLRRGEIPAALAGRLWIASEDRFASWSYETLSSLNARGVRTLKGFYELCNALEVSHGSADHVSAEVYLTADERERLIARYLLPQSVRVMARDTLPLAELLQTVYRNLIRVDTLNETQQTETARLARAIEAYL